MVNSIGGYLALFVLTGAGMSSILMGYWPVGLIFLALAGSVALRLFYPPYGNHERKPKMLVSSGAQAFTTKDRVFIVDVTVTRPGAIIRIEVYGTGRNYKMQAKMGGFFPAIYNDSQVEDKINEIMEIEGYPHGIRWP